MRGLWLPRFIVAIFDQAQVARKAMYRLGLIKELQPEIPWQLERVKEVVADAHAELSESGLAWWRNYETPQSVVGPFSLYVAGKVAHVFQTDERAQFMRSRRVSAERRIARVVHQKNTSGRVVAAEYF